MEGGATNFFPEAVHPVSVMPGLSGVGSFLHVVPGYRYACIIGFPLCPDAEAVGYHEEWWQATLSLEATGSTGSLTPGTDKHTFLSHPRTFSPPPPPPPLKGSIVRGPCPCHTGQGERALRSSVSSAEGPVEQGSTGLGLHLGAGTRSLRHLVPLPL